MLCKNCEAELKKVGQTNGWLTKIFYWCPECGTFVQEEHGIKKTPDYKWYKPGYLIEQEIT